jgi:hypothetical protein
MLANPGLLRFARNDGSSQQVMIYGDWYYFAPHLRFQPPQEIGTSHSSHGGEFGERVDPVKDAKHRLCRREL